MLIQREVLHSSSNIIVCLLMTCNGGEFAVSLEYGVPDCDIRSRIPLSAGKDEMEQLNHYKRERADYFESA